MKRIIYTFIIVLLSCTKEIDPTYIIVDDIPYKRISNDYIFTKNDVNQHFISTIIYYNATDHGLSCFRPWVSIDCARHPYNVYTEEFVQLPDRSMLDKIDKLNKKYNESGEFFAPGAKMGFVYKSHSSKFIGVGSGRFFFSNWYIVRARREYGRKWIDITFEYLDDSQLPPY